MKPALANVFEFLVNWSSQQRRSHEVTTGREIIYSTASTQRRGQSLMTAWMHSTDRNIEHCKRNSAVLPGRSRVAEVEVGLRHRGRRRLPPRRHSLCGLRSPLDLPRRLRYHRHRRSTARPVGSSSLVEVCTARGHCPCSAPRSLFTRNSVSPLTAICLWGTVFVNPLTLTVVIGLRVQL